MTCFICGGSFHKLYEIDRFTPTFEIIRCDGCSLERKTNLRDSEQFYTEEYYTGKADYSYRDERRQEKYDSYVWNARLNTISSWIGRPANFLDIGCAFGGFVQAAADFGYNASGFDVSEYAVKEAKARGRNVARLSSDNFKELTESSQDIITLIEVIEHIPYPELALRAIAKALRDNGLLVIQTANFAGRQAKMAGKNYHYYLPGHLYYYNANNLQSFLSQIGFTKFKLYRPTDFGLLPKLKKSRGSFRSFGDYKKWIGISKYHLESKIHFGDFSQTSSMVLYAQKNNGSSQN